MASADDNSLFVEQAGRFNDASVAQTGIANRAIGSQSASFAEDKIDGLDDRDAGLRTNALGAIGSVPGTLPNGGGDSNVVSITQDGVDNRAYSFQFGSDNVTTTEQTGDGNAALQAHVGNRNTTAIHQDGGDVGSIVVVGNRNAYTLDMTGGSVGGPVAVTIYGDGAGTGGPSTISVTTSP